MKSHSFALENLEGRALFSVAAPTIYPAPLPVRLVTTAVHHHPPTTPLVGAFNVSGTYTPPGPGHNPDSGSTYHFDGSGRKRSLGQFTMTGDLQGPGFIATGRYHGYLTLTSSQGTVVLRVTGPEQTPGPLPATLVFKIVNGSGVYSRASGKGTIVLSASATTNKFVFQFNPAT